MQHKKYLNRRVILFLLINCISTTSAQDIWRKIYAHRYELTFYASVASSYDNAKQICNSSSADIVKLDDEYVRKAVYFTIENSTLDRFWIGALRNSTNANEWIWESGSPVNMSTVEWYSNNTNSSIINTIIRTTDNKLVAEQNTKANSGIICRSDIGLSYPWKVDTAAYHVTLYNKRVNNWDEAVSMCNDINATLVQLNDADVKELVYGIISILDGVDLIWVGLTRSCRTCNDWAWVDGTAASSIDWNSGEPNNAGQSDDKAVIRKTNKKLYDTGTTSVKAAVICQAKRIFCSTTSNECENGGTCSEDTSGISSCKCTAGYYGATCSIDYCDKYPNACENNGICSHKPQSPFYKCKCAANGYYGDTCKDDYCVTHSNTCKNSGTCSHIVVPPFFRCYCSTNGYYGSTCERNYCVINRNTCKNSGTCIQITSSPFFRCDCAKNGYFGQTCEDNYCAIYPNTCKNGGTCSQKSTYPFYNCQCAANGYYGHRCERTYCSYHANPCANGGKCISSVYMSPYYKCDCTGTEYCGKFCDTGHPVAVENTEVEKNTDFCVVTWSLPNVPNNQVIGYEVLIMENWIYQSLGKDSQFTTMSTVKVDYRNMNYTLNTKFNRNYCFNITAKTCGGKGEAVVANGTCSTKRSVPYIVPAPTLSETFVSGPTREIIVYLPDMSNGPVSCSFVIVKHGKHDEDTGLFGTQQLQEAAEAALEDNADLDYLAIAIPSENMVSDKYVTELGNGNSTVCDVSNIFTGNKRQKRNVDISTYYVGKNKHLLIDGEVYGFFIVTTTPVEDGQVLIQKSKVQYFTNGEIAHNSASPTVWIAGLIIGLVLAAAAWIFGIVFFVKYKKLTKQGQKQQKSSEAIKDAYELDISRPNGSSNTPRKDLPNGQTMYETISDPAYENL